MNNFSKNSGDLLLALVKAFTNCLMNPKLKETMAFSEANQTKPLKEMLSFLHRYHLIADEEEFPYLASVSQNNTYFREFLLEL